MKTIITFAILAFLIGAVLRQYVQIRKMNDHMIRLATVVEADHRQYWYLIRMAANPPRTDAEIAQLEARGIKVMVNRPMGGGISEMADIQPQKGKERTQ